MFVIRKRSSNCLHDLIVNDDSLLIFKRGVNGTHILRRLSLQRRTCVVVCTIAVDDDFPTCILRNHKAYSRKYVLLD